MLVEYLESQSGWRDGKAEEYSDDLRNARSANALASLATYVRDGKADASVVAQIETPSAEDATGVLTLGKQARHEVSRYGFEIPSEHEHEAFLASLAELIEEDELKDWTEWVREGAFPLDAVPKRIRLTVELRLADGGDPRP